MHDGKKKIRNSDFKFRTNTINKINITFYKSEWQELKWYKKLQWRLCQLTGLIKITIQ